MATGKLRLEIQGDWDIDDLETISSVLRLGYAYFYWISLRSQMPGHLRSKFSRYFWSGERIRENFAIELYESIPNEDRLRLQSIHYASPGWIEVAGILAATGLLGKVVLTWANAGNAILDLFERIEGFFEERKLKKIGRTISLDDMSAKNIDDARLFCAELSEKLGISSDELERLIDLTGNPISTLRLLATIAHETRNILTLEEDGKIRFPKGRID